MSLRQVIFALVCVLAISIGQLLFKRVGLALGKSGSWFDVAVLVYAGCAFTLYAGATLLWIHLLRSVELSRVYPFMALSFVAVPLASAWLFGDRLSAMYFLGVILITLGVGVIGRSG